jgi:hypothetical protein
MLMTMREISMCDLVYIFNIYTNLIRAFWLCITFSIYCKKLINKYNVINIINK